MRDETSPGPRGDDEATMELFKSYRRSSDPEIKGLLVQRFVWIGNVAARRFAHRGEPLEDLFQVAMYGVVKAVERFDPELGNSFATFALPTVIGELRRHFRDSTWAVRVNRRAKELHLA